MAERTVEKNGIEFVVTEEYTEADIERVQQKSKAMMKTIIDILNKHNIDYMVAHGTLLGMIRHQGFIPWDDDLDIVMLRPAYNRFLAVASDELSANKYFVQAEFSSHWPMYFSKLRKNHTACLEKYHPEGQ